MSRPVAGLACRIRIPVRQYQAVALLVGERSHVIRLMHRDVGLSLDVEEFQNYATAEEYRERLADYLGFPRSSPPAAPPRTTVPPPPSPARAAADPSRRAARAF